VLPRLDGKLSGDSIRVPVPVGSIVELNTTVARDVTRDEVLTAYRVAADGRLAGILEYSDDPLVSSDIIGNPASSVFDSALICECTEARRLSSPFGRDCRDGGVWPMRAFAGPLQALNFREAGSRQSLGELVNGPAIGGHDLVVEGGDLVPYEESNH
jgi:hypothetical protein